MADVQKIHDVYICNFVSSIDWQIRFMKTCSRPNASDTVGVCIVTVCIRMMMMMTLCA